MPTLVNVLSLLGPRRRALSPHCVSALLLTKSYIAATQLTLSANGPRMVLPYTCSPRKLPTPHADCAMAIPASAVRSLFSMMLLRMTVPGAPKTTMPPSVASMMWLFSTSELEHANEMPSDHSLSVRHDVLAGTYASELGRDGVVEASWAELVVGNTHAAAHGGLGSLGADVRGVVERRHSQPSWSTHPCKHVQPRGSKEWTHSITWPAVWPPISIIPWDLGIRGPCLRLPSHCC